MAESFDDILNLESATAEELGRLLASQPADLEETPHLSAGSRRAKAHARELLSQDLDVPDFGRTRPK